MKLTRELSNCVAQPEQDRLAPFVNFAAGVIERVHRHIREDEQIGFPTHSRQDMFQQTRKVFQILRRIGEDQKLRQRELTFTEDAKARDQRLARVTLAHYGGAKRMET